MQIMAKGERGQGEECLSRSLLEPNSLSPPLHTKAGYGEALRLPQPPPCSPAPLSCHRLANHWDRCKDAAFSPTALRAASQRAKWLVFWEQNREMRTWVDKAEGKKGTLQGELDPRGPRVQQWICSFFWKREGSAQGGKMEEFGEGTRFRWM